MGLSLVILTPGHRFKMKISQLFPAGSLTKIHQSWRAWEPALGSCVLSESSENCNFPSSLFIRPTASSWKKSILLLPEEIHSVLLWEFNIKVLKRRCNLTKTYTFDSEQSDAMCWPVLNKKSDFSLWFFSVKSITCSLECFYMREKLNCIWRRVKDTHCTQILLNLPQASHSC